MTEPLVRAKQLIALALNESTSQEESRTCAVAAIKIIEKHGLLDARPTSARHVATGSLGDLLDELRRQSDVFRAQERKRTPLRRPAPEPRKAPPPPQGPAPKPETDAERVSRMQQEFAKHANDLLRDAERRARESMAQAEAGKKE